MPSKTTKQRVLFAVFMVPIILVPLWFVAWWAYSSTQIQQRYREGELFAAQMRALETDFRTYFHDRKDYKAWTLEDLKAAGVLSRGTSAFIAAHNGKYIPFSPATPPDTVVMQITENWFSTFDLTKDELTRAPLAAPSPAKP